MASAVCVLVGTEGVSGTVTFSILGTLVSTLLIAPFVYFGARASFASSTAFAPDFSYTEALAFSSLISAIDPGLIGIFVTRW